MRPILDYKDVVQLVDPVIDEYGGEKIGRIETVNGLFISRTGFSHTDNRDEINSDAEFYIDPEHFFVQEVYKRLEGMLIISDRYGSDDSESWYRVIDVSVGEDKLLTNQIDNILLRLKKTTEIGYVS